MTAACCAALLAWSLPAFADGDEFERAFSAAGEPKSLHYQAIYRDASGGLHRLEVWREDAYRLRRTTDGMLDIFISREPRGDDFRMTMLDHRRQLLIDVSRNSLYRVGRAADWFALAHGLSMPMGAYTLTRLPGPPGQAEAVSSSNCQWYQLTQPGRRDAICWSEALHLPMRIVAQPSGATVWSVVFAETRAITPSAFQFNAHGLVRVNADQDIQAD